MTTLLRATGSAELLRIVPALAGFTPRRSVVLLPFQGARSYGAMRLDLPDDAVPLETYADAAVGLVARVEGTDAVALVVYTDDHAHHTPDGLVLPLSVAVDELLGCAEDAGLRVVDALCVMPNGWSSYLDDEPALTDPAKTEGLFAEFAEDVSGDQTAGSELPQADLIEKERVARVLRDLTELLGPDGRGRPTGTEHPSVVEAAMMLDDIPVFLESVLATPDDPVATAALLWCLGRPMLRDVAIVQWASALAGGVRALDAQLAFSMSGRPVPDDVGEVFLGRGPTPDVHRVRSALSATRWAIACAPRASRPAALTVAAWLSWALGSSTHAGLYLSQARAIDQSYSLARLLDTMISAALLPEWAFRRGVGG